MIETETDIFMQLLTVLQQNPILLGLLISVIRSLGGYVTECFTQKKLVTYEGAKLLETLTLYETFFITVGQIGGLSNQWTIVLAVVVDTVRSVKKEIATGVTKLKTTS